MHKYQCTSEADTARDSKQPRSVRAIFRRNKFTQDSLQKLGNAFRVMPAENISIVMLQKRFLVKLENGDVYSYFVACHCLLCSNLSLTALCFSAGRWTLRRGTPPTCTCTRARTSSSTCPCACRPGSPSQSLLRGEWVGWGGVGSGWSGWCRWDGVGRVVW